MNHLGKIIFSIGLAVSSLFGFHHEAPAQLGSSFQPVQASQFTLSGAGINSSASTIQLNSFTLPDPAKTPITMSMFGDIGYAVVEPQTSKIENITFTGVTQNANGTALLTGVTRGINFVSPYSGSPSRALSHAGGSYLILSNPAAFYGQQFLFANNIGTSTAVLTFSSTTPPRYDSVAAQASGTFISTTSEFASITYVNRVVAGGCATASDLVTGCVRLATQAQAQGSIFSALAPTVLTTLYSTSSPYTSGIWTPITRNDGKLSPLFTATSSTDVYNWGGVANFLASTTFQATSTFAASNVLSRAAIFNLIPYAFPSTQGASSSVLTNTGNGTLIWSKPVGNQYSYASTSAATIGAGLTYTSSSLVVPASALTASSTITIKGSYQCVSGGSNANGCTLSITDTNGNLYVAYTVPAVISHTYNQTFDATVLANNAANAQRSVLTGMSADTPGPAVSVLTVGNTSSADWTTAKTFIITLTAGAGTSNTSTLNSFSIVVNP